MEELIMRWKVMRLDLQRQMEALMDGRLTTGTNNRDTTEETKAPEPAAFTGTRQSTVSGGRVHCPSCL